MPLQPGSDSDILYRPFVGLIPVFSGDGLAKKDYSLPSIV